MKPSTPKGTRDFNPVEMIRRNYILNTIRSVYEKYGYKQIETPAMELLSTLTGKYGEEGDQLLFKILNSRLHESSKKDQLLSVFQKALNSNINSDLLTERALRYDLTVPFARYVVMHQHEITFPFKRFQIQPVWRADKPQKGRYREFYQCDADVIGSDSLLNEVELILIINEVFSELSVDVTVKINNRKILSGIAEIAGIPDKIIELTVALDKLDKIGKEKVIDELKQKGFSEMSIEKIIPLLNFKGSTSAKLDFLKQLLHESEIGLKGVKELETVFSFPGTEKTELDITLARGLNYYTGAIIEVAANEIQIGSIAGGGRYDDLTGIFGLKGISGVGISFGIDRIYDVMLETGKFEALNLKNSGTKVLLVNFGGEEENYCFSIIQQIRKAGVHAELYPDQAKLKKQMAYANSNNIPYVILAGSEELNSGTVTLKNMITGDQGMYTIEETINVLLK